MKIQEGDEAFIIKTILPWCEKEVGKISKDDLRDAMRHWKFPAKWKLRQTEDGYIELVCDACGCNARFRKTRYCPNCGRRMENV